MEDKPKFAYPSDGKFSAREEAILDYLYEHPDGIIGTVSLMEILKPEHSTAEEQRQAFEEIQYGIETLVAARLVREKRVSESDKVQYIRLRLTAKGQAEAIKQQRRTKYVFEPNGGVIRIESKRPNPADRD